MSEKIVPKAVYLGLITFAVLYLGALVMAHLFILSKAGMLFWLQVVLLVFSGYITGRFAKMYGWLNGVMVGIAAPVVLAFGMSVITVNISAAGAAFAVLGAYWLLQSIICCAIGGFIWDLQSKK
ncbi:MAG: hypothetical protein OQL27_03045 [Sedimenticola sp.]|nr:hypothetical protein [Sedimenticola sp.]